MVKSSANGPCEKSFPFETVPTRLTYTAEYNGTPSAQSVKFTLPQLQTMTKDHIRVILVDMLKREDELRLSPPCQEMFGRIGEQHHRFNTFVSNLQSHVSLEFLVDPSVGVELIRSAVSLYPDDEEIKSIPHYVRHNRCKAGNLRIGDTPPDVAVTDTEGNALRLADLLDQDRPVVLMGASHS